ncbi:MAG: Transcription factor iws1 [Chaenotheca gracillima]|nr:MAG: Transcription factor iws1 [Chaenotheca gracillima]
MSSEPESRPQTPLPEAGNDAGDPNRPLSEERDTPPPPVGNPHQDMGDLENDIADLSDESDLSDVDEAQFEDFDPANVAIDDRPAIAVDESNVGLIGVHKRKRVPGAEGEEGAKKKKKEGRREKPKKSRKKRDEDEFSGGEELEGKRERKKKSLGGERKERAKARKATPEPDKEEELSPEERRRRALDRAMDEALKNPNRRRRRKDGEDLEDAADAMVENMRQRMAAAAQADNEARQEGHAAVQKLKMLPEVVAFLNRNTLHHAIVDPEANLLEAVKFFLEPLSDGSLPAFSIQRDLFAALAKLPINRDSLVASGIGKVTLFYTKSKRPETTIKRQAERLLGEWSRPILKRTDDYRKRALVTAEYDPSKLPIRRPAQSFQLSQEEARAKALAPPIRTNRARIESGPTSYDIAPRSVVPAQSMYSRQMGAAGGDTFKRMKQRHLNKVAASGGRR